MSITVKNIKGKVEGYKLPKMDYEKIAIVNDRIVINGVMFLDSEKTPITKEADLEICVCAVKDPVYVKNGEVKFKTHTFKIENGIMRIEDGLLSINNELKMDLLNNTLASREDSKSYNGSKPHDDSKPHEDTKPHKDTEPREDIKPHKDAKVQIDLSSEKDDAQQEIENTYHDLICELEGSVCILNNVKKRIRDRLDKIKNKRFKK